MSKKIKNTVIKGITINSIGAEGKCVTRHGDLVVFVDKVVPGDIVDIKIIRKKKTYFEAIPINFIQYSPDRITPFCDHFGICGGCKWQHLDYDVQLRYKQQQVIDSLERIAKVEIPDILPIVRAEKSQYYRNKLEFTFSDNRWFTTEEIANKSAIDKDGLGFHMPGRFDKIIDIQKCYLQSDISNKIRLKMRALAKSSPLPFFNLINQTGFYRNLIVRNSNIGELMVIAQFGYNDQKVITQLLNDLASEFPEITSLQYVINKKKNETFHDLEVILHRGSPFITEEMDGLKFKIGPKSFFQTNSQQALTLYRLALQYADLTGSETVYDLYTGTGTIATFVANKAKKVVGIEYVPEAIEDAKKNAAFNDIANVTFFAGDMRDLLTDKLVAEHGHPNVIITDPPRAGMHKDVIATLLNIAAPKIVYISCNPATQARDVGLLDEKYKVTAIQPIDMFPQTYHVENICLLELRG